MNESEISERVFFCTKEGAHKFWRVCIQNEMQTVCWGRIGTMGQTLERTFVDGDEAQAATNALIAQKVAKGYVEVSREEANAVVPVPVQRAGKGSAPFQLLLLFDAAQDRVADDAALSAPLQTVPMPSATVLPLSLF